MFASPNQIHSKGEGAENRLLVGRKRRSWPGWTYLSACWRLQTSRSKRWRRRSKSAYQSCRFCFALWWVRPSSQPWRAPSPHLSKRGWLLRWCGKCDQSSFPGFYSSFKENSQEKFSLLKAAAAVAAAVILRRCCWSSCLLRSAGLLTKMRNKVSDSWSSCPKLSGLFLATEAVFLNQRFLHSVVQTHGLQPTGFPALPQTFPGFFFLFPPSNRIQIPQPEFFPPS